MPALPSDFAAISDQLFGSLLSQHARLITLETAQGSDLPDSLMVESFSGTEAVNALFCFDIDALSLSTAVDLKQFIGEEITLRLLQADGSKRAWHGYCTEAQWLGADGGVARYRLRLEPFLAFLRLRRDAFIFQDKDAQEIVSDLLADYPQANFAWDVRQPLRKRAICTQYRESDLDFLTRLLASEGLSYRFEHDQAGSGSDSGSASQAKHRLVVFDAHATAPAMPGDSSIRYHGVRASEASDTINQFAAIRQVQSNAVTVSSWDFAQLSAPASELRSSLAAGELPALSIYDGVADRAYTDSAAASDHSELQLRALEMQNKRYQGGGAVRQLAAGHAFTLSQHAHYLPGDDAFTMLSIEHNATNNIAAGVARLLNINELERGTYRNTFSCVRLSVPVVPAASAVRRPQNALGAQVALVVGLAGAPLSTERDHQIKVQFAWQRGQAPLAGGLTETGSPVDSKGNAPGNETSGTWVRVAEALAGANWGTNFTPRIGSEVVLDFIEGDMDRPVVIAQLYNGSDLPPYSAGVDSGVNHAGYLSGMHSHNLEDGGYNQWVVDDTQAQLRMRLASSSAASQLNLGYLIAQAPTSAQRGSYRGIGFELRSDAWGSLRGAEGVLISTSARQAKGSSVSSTQMDVQESVAQLKAAHSTVEAISQAATHQNALISSDANKAQVNRITALDQQKKGKYTAAINGHTAHKAKPGTRDLDPAQPVEKFESAIVHLEGPASINLASPASTALFAGQQLHWTTQADSHWAAAHTVASVSGNATSLFTHAGGIQAYASNGPLSLQAHTDKLELLADQEITIISVNDKIEIKAKQKITLMAGQSSVTLEGGNITFTCPGNFTVKAAQHVFDAGENKAAELGKLPDQLSPNAPPPHSLFIHYDEQIMYKDEHDKAIAEMPIHVLNQADTAHTLVEKSLATGAIERMNTPSAQPLEYALRYIGFIPKK
ncbi:type VI secretion system Vgr family protein [Undibacterium sp. Ren11W]|uniref:type VI secretion system Vgr family protein n=1 Tax=Undibacterium sp. Ren11W TaxID=3413045 RepID=UPI003BF45ABB